MPNWCSNYALITGSKEAIAKIKEAIDSIESGSDPSVFKTLVGIHPEVTQEEYDSGKWYGANCDYWGTKWDVRPDDCSFNFDEESFTMSPETAWSPPIGFYEALAKKYGVKVEAEYNESGVDFAGQVFVDEEGNVNDNCYPYYEGIYKMDSDWFFHELESYFECVHDDEEEVTEEYIDSTFPFVSKEDREEIIEKYIKQD